MPDIKTIILICVLGGAVGIALLMVAAARLNKKVTPLRRGFQIVWVVVLSIGLTFFLLGGALAMGIAMLQSYCSSLH